MDPGHCSGHRAGQRSQNSRLGEEVALASANSLVSPTDLPQQ